MSESMNDLFCRISNDNALMMMALRQPMKIFWKEDSVQRIPFGLLRGMGMKFKRKYTLSCISGVYEYPIQKLLKKLLKSGTVFYDVGANVGFFTLLAARLVGQKGEVFAFEPYGPVTEILRENIGINSLNNVTVVPKGVGSNTGVLEFIPQGSTMGHFALNAGSLPKQFNSDSPSIPVPVVSLDDFVQDIPAPDVIKIDVEGAELDVLRGAERLLSSGNKPVVIVELQTSEIANAARVIFEKHGYAFYNINCDPISTLEYNTLAIPRNNSELMR